MQIVIKKLKSNLKRTYVRFFFSKTKYLLFTFKIIYDKIVLLRNVGGKYERVCFKKQLPANR